MQSRYCRLVADAFVCFGGFLVELPAKDSFHPGRHLLPRLQYQYKQFRTGMDVVNGPMDGDESRRGQVTGGAGVSYPT